MVGRNGISKIQQNTCVSDGLSNGQIPGHSIEEGRMLDVGRRFIPREKFSARRLQALPVLRALLNLLVNILEHCWDDELALDALNLFARRPDVAQEDFSTVFGFSEWLGLKININGACQSIRDNKQRRS